MNQDRSTYLAFCNMPIKALAFSRVRNNVTQNREGCVNSELPHALIFIHRPRSSCTKCCTTSVNHPSQVLQSSCLLIIIGEICHPVKHAASFPIEQQKHGEYYEKSLQHLLNP